MFAVPQQMKSSGKIKWYLRYRNEEGKLLYYPKEKYPDFWTKKEADEWINRNRHKLTSIKKQADIYREIKTKHKYPEFQGMIDTFIYRQKIDAPNSWKSSILYMERYVMDFFLNRKGIRDINEWINYFEPFKKYLNTQATVKGKAKLIEYSTKNHAIRTLNKFITVMASENIVKIPNPPKCKPFPKHLLNTRGYKDVIMPEEYFALRDKLEYSKGFFILLYHTGLRFNEAYSLHIDSILFDDELPEVLEKKFEKYKVKIFGCIVLEDQIDGKTRTEAKRNAEKDKDCKTLYRRKPLKSCKKIEAKNNRTIPIMSKEAWDVLVKNYNRTCDEYNERVIESDKAQDYFLFDLEVNKLRRELNKVTKKGYHSLRHSFITRLVGEYRDMALTRMITGHRSEAFEAYNHIYEMISIESSNKRKIKKSSRERREKRAS